MHCINLFSLGRWEFTYQTLHKWMFVSWLSTGLERPLQICAELVSQLLFKLQKELNLLHNSWHLISFLFLLLWREWMGCFLLNLYLFSLTWQQWWVKCGFYKQCTDCTGVFSGLCGWCVGMKCYSTLSWSYSHITKVIL